jgi:hypothetical protein
MFLKWSVGGHETEKFIARTFAKVPCGAVRRMVISPVSSSLSIPVISASGFPPSTYRRAPSIPR